jgi:hypothetical protein
MGMLQDDGMNPMFAGPNGPRGFTNLGDYVMTESQLQFLSTLSLADGQMVLIRSWSS